MCIVHPHARAWPLPSVPFMPFGLLHLPSSVLLGSLNAARASFGSLLRWPARVKRVPALSAHREIFEERRKAIFMFQWACDMWASLASWTLEPAFRTFSAALLAGMEARARAMGKVAGECMDKE